MAFALVSSADLKRVNSHGVALCRLALDKDSALSILSFES